MEPYKKYGRSAFAKHLRRSKGKWTKTMANGKSRSKSRLDIKKSLTFTGTSSSSTLLGTTQTKEYARKSEH